MMCLWWDGSPWPRSGNRISESCRLFLWRPVSADASGRVEDLNLRQTVLILRATKPAPAWIEIGRLAQLAIPEKGRTISADRELKVDC
jgi:hypothetical protein